MKSISLHFSLDRSNKGESVKARHLADMMLDRVIWSPLLVDIKFKFFTLSLMGIRYRHAIKVGLR